MNYYKGYIIAKNELPKNSFTVCTYNGKITDYTDFYKDFLTLSEKEKNILDKEFSSNKTLSLKSKEILKKINISEENNIPIMSYYNVIFEIIKDKYGNLYGKELLTGSIFPIFKCKSTYKAIKEDNIKVYYTSLEPRNIWVKKANGVCYSNTFGKRSESDFTNFPNATFEKLYNHLPNVINPFKLINLKTIIYGLSYEFDFQNMSRIEYLLENNGPANQNEIDNYIINHKEGKFFFKKNPFKTDIIEFSKENCFTSEITVIKEKEKTLLNQSKIVSLMENIEFMLLKLGKIDEDLKNKYNKEYEEIINSENSSLNVKPLSINSLILLSNKIELSIKMIKKNARNILEYTSLLKREYIDNFLNKKDNKTTISLEEIDKIVELFLKLKDSYSITDQRKVINEFAFIYLFELLENIDNITEVELKNSYINVCLKSIIININALMEIGLFKNNLLVDLESEIDVSNIYNIIKSIEIENKNKDKIINLVR